jgi:hypothetical protein
VEDFHIPVVGLVSFCYCFRLSSEIARSEHSAIHQVMSTTNCRVRVFGTLDADVSPSDWVQVPEASLQGVGLPPGCRVRARTGSIVCEIEPPAGSDFDIFSWLSADASRGDDLLQHCVGSVGCEGKSTAAYVWGPCREIPSSPSFSELPGGGKSPVSLVSVFRLTPGISDASGCRMARDMSEMVHKAQKEGCYPAGRFTFLFQSPTTEPPLDLHRISRNLSPQTSEILERHGFDVSCDAEGWTAQLRPNAAPVCVLVCFQGALYDRLALDAAVVCRRLCATASRPRSFHYGALLSPAALLATLGDDSGALTRGNPQSALQRFEKVVRYNYEDAMLTGGRVSLETLGLVDCEETRVLFGDLEDPQGSQHGGLLWRVLKRVQILSGPKLLPASFADDMASGQVSSPSWPQSPVTPVALMLSGPFSAPRHLCHAVERKMAEKIGPVGPDSFVLFHGTSARSGRSILSSGVNFRKCNAFTDFGPAFYTSPQFDYAFQAALESVPRVRSFSSIHVDGCVLAFVFAGDALRDLKAAEVVVDGTDWARAVTGYRAMTDEAEQDIPRRALVATVLTGPICDNPNFLEVVPRGAPQPTLGHLQVAFRSTGGPPGTSRVLALAKVYGVFWVGDEDATY